MGSRNRSRSRVPIVVALFGIGLVLSRFGASSHLEGVATACSAFARLQALPGPDAGAIPRNARVALTTGNYPPDDEAYELQSNGARVEVRVDRSPGEVDLVPTHLLAPNASYTVRWKALEPIITTFRTSSDVDTVAPAIESVDPPIIRKGVSDCDPPVSLTVKARVRDSSPVQLAVWVGDGEIAPVGRPAGVGLLKGGEANIALKGPGTVSAKSRYAIIAVDVAGNRSPPFSVGAPTAPSKTAPQPESPDAAPTEPPPAKRRSGCIASPGTLAAPPMEWLLALPALVARRRRARASSTVAQARP